MIRKLTRKPLFWIAIVFVVFMPVFINGIVSYTLPPIITIAGDTNSWVGFYGTYVGTILGALIAAGAAIYVLKSELDERNRTTQLNERLNKLTEFTNLFYEASNSLLNANNLLAEQFELKLTYKHNETLARKLEEAFTKRTREFDNVNIKMIAMLPACEIIFRDNDVFKKIKQLHLELNKTSLELEEKYRQWFRYLIVYENETKEIEEKRTEILNILREIETGLLLQHNSYEEGFSRFAESIYKSIFNNT